MKKPRKYSEDELEELDHEYREVLRRQRDEAIGALRLIFNTITLCDCLAGDPDIERVQKILSRYPSPKDLDHQTYQQTYESWRQS